MLKEGTQAPAFSLTDQSGTVHTLKQYEGKFVLLYFYPKDDTPGCTKEACGFRDQCAELKKHNVVVLGVSADSKKSHAKFAEKFHLTFPLLSDPEKSTIEAYEAWGQKKFMGKEYMGILRSSYLLDPNGVILKAYSTVKPEEHPLEVLQDVQHKEVL